MSARLIVRKDTGELLFDTSKICYGLVKSGNMVAIETWPRKYLRSAQLDPNDGSNWMDSNRTGDTMFGFTITNAISPIVFIVGKGCLNGTAVSGSSMTFMYAGGSAATKFYCFDLMADNIAGRPYLKTWNEDGEITFNSLQPPLNVVDSVQAPSPPAANDQFGRKLLAYAGGRNELIRYQTATQDAQMHCVVDIALSAGIEYAAFLPFSRSATLWNTLTISGSMLSQCGVNEGAYGRTGGISFMFANSGGSPVSYPSMSASSPASYTAIPTDRIPIALVIRTTGLPFPYN
ncbi:hypothetical protein [Pseudomonas sp. DG56-2]|nr:hypothetical protein [Pseudomonas sp. DG56-2]